MKNLIIYHRVDYDGLFSLLVGLDKLGKKVSKIGLNYGDEMPTEEELEKYDKVYILDFSLPPTIMKFLYNSGRLIWVDHHVTAIEDSKTYGYDDAEGIREIGVAAVELSFRYFNPEKTIIPKFIQYLGAFDVWNLEKFDWNNIVLPLQYGLKTEHGLSLTNLKPTIIYDEEELERLIDIGRGVLKFLNKTWKSWVKTNSFEVTIGDRFKAISMITPQHGSSTFDSVGSDYDIFLTTNWDNKTGKYKIGIYKNPGKEPEFSAGKYLKEKYGGGGHECAAGAMVDEEVFIRLIKDKKI